MAVDTLQEGIPRVPGKTRFQDFAPDADPTTPGILLEMSNMVPTTKGYRTYPRLTKLSVNALPSACLGTYFGWIGVSPVFLMGISNKLYYLNTSTATLTDSALSPSAITGRWRFDYYNGEVVAVNGIDAPFKYDGSTFGNLGGSPPVSSIVQATEYGLFLILTNSSNWRSSLNSALWTPSIATQTVSGTIRKGHGNITAAHRIRGGIVLYKRRHMSFGQFSGPPFFWDFGNGVSDEIGVDGQEAVANLGDVHLLPGPDDFYRFDGYSLQRIPNNLKEWFFDTLNQSLAFLITSRWDQKKSLVFWHFPSKNASPQTALDSWICYNLRTGRWSADTAAEVIDMPFAPGLRIDSLTYATLTTTYPTYADMNFRYGDLLPRSVDLSGAIKTSDHALHLYNGFVDTGFFTTHDYGDRENVYEVTGIRPHYTIKPSSATIQPLNQRLPGSTPVAGTARALSSDGSFDFMNTARLQRYKHVADSDFEITGMDVSIEYAGED